MTQEIGLFEAMHSQRAIRYLKPDPVPDELIRKLLEAAIRAPNGANRQEWSFVVVRDPQTRKKIADLYLDAVVSQKSPDLAPDQEKIYTATKHLADHLHEVPVFIFPCHTHEFSSPDRPWGSYIYPAVQNILLAARGLGLGSVLITRHKYYEKEIKDILGIPEGVETAALLPIGYPAEGARYGPTRRRPVEEVTFHERWGNR